MEYSKNNLAVLEAVKLGYKVRKDGEVIGVKGNVLKHRINGGYRFFSIRMDKKARPLKVHMLQAYQKFGEKAFDKKMVTRHGKGGALDNSWDNINIGTHSDNMMDKPPEQRRKDASNPSHDHAAIVADRNSGMTYTKIMEKYGISSKGTISFIINKSMSIET